MTKTTFLTVLFAFLAACAYKLPEAQVLKIFARHSFKEHDPEKLRSLLRENGISGLKSEDKYAEVLQSRLKVKESQEKGRPSFGLLVGSKGGAYFLLRVFKGSPAEAAGFRDGDKLLSVNSSLPGTEEFLKALSGEQKLRLKVARRAVSGISEFEAEIKAGEFQPPAVFGFYEPETRSSFVRVGLFFEDSASIAAAGLAGLQKYGGKNIILDLRGNRGGSPGEAAALLKLFALNPGPVMAIASRHKGYTQVFEAASRGRFAGRRLLVLVDPATSMAGEVFASSLKELAGAVVVGGRTSGSVSIPKTFNLGEGRGLKLTVARLVPPSGNDLEGAGFAPDSPVEASGPAWSGVPADALLKDAAYLRALELLTVK